MLDAALAMVEETGLTVSLAHLSFEEVVHRADVARSASYRVWRTKEAFFDELLLQLAGPHWQGTGAFDPETLELAWVTVARRSDELATEEGRRAAMLEAARVGAQRNFEAMSSRPDWHAFVAISATVLTLPDGDFKRALQAALQESEARFLTAMAAFYERIMTVLGLRLRPEFGTDLRLLAAVGAAVVEGLGLRRIAAPEVVAQVYSGALFGAPSVERWTVPSIGYAAIVVSMLEFDPDFDVDAARVILAGPPPAAAG